MNDNFMFNIFNLLVFVIWVFEWFVDVCYGCDVLVFGWLIVWEFVSVGFVSYFVYGCFGVLIMVEGCFFLKSCK